MTIEKIAGFNHPVAILIDGCGHKVAYIFEEYKGV